MLLQFTVQFDSLLLLLSSMFFEFFTFEYFSFLCKFAETKLSFTMVLELVKYNHLKSFYYNHMSLYFLLFTKKSFALLTLIENNFWICCFILCFADFQCYPGNLHDIWKHSFREILQYSYSAYFCNNICNGFRKIASQFELLLRMKPVALFQEMNF